MTPSSQQRAVPKHQLVRLYRQAVEAGLPLEVVDQKIQAFADRFHLTVQVEEHDDTQQMKKLQKAMPLRTRIMVHVLPAAFVSLGLFLVSNAAWPILAYFVFKSPDMVEHGLIAPIPEQMVLGLPGQKSMQAQVTTLDAGDDVNGDNVDGDELIILADQLDYTNLNNWFPNLTPEQADVLATSEVTAGAQASTEYTLDIPAVKVEEARVKIGGTTLDKNLIQYPGTANPGDPGSPVIFGHSVLRQFYNPSVKNSRRYMSIFSKIMTLKHGDKVYVTRDGVKYTYTVQEKTEVKPEDVFILEQNYDAKTLKLITCVPEGTYLRRGVVIATLDTE